MFQRFLYAFAVAVICAPPVGFAQSTGTDGLVLSVDATDTDHRILRATEEIPVAPGQQTLFYPEWLPGTHSSAFSSVKRLAGLRFTARGKVISWTRDTVDMGAIHIDVPPDVHHVTAEFQYLTPSVTQSDNSRVSMSQAIVIVEWHSVVLYPKGKPVAQIPVTANVKLPAGWAYGCALETAQATDGVIQFKTTDLNTLVDSPLLSGRYFKKFDLSAGVGAPVSLDVAADRPEDLAATDDQIAAHRALVAQARKLYQSEHYGHYDFLLTVSETIGGIGLEHHQSSEDSVGHDYFTSWADGFYQRDLLPHEYTHSWNGKFRRPADLTTPDYNVPMRDTLLWVYEGQTQFWGKVLSVRSGLITAEQQREQLALTADYYGNLPGAAWRNLQDTTNEEILSGHGNSTWSTWQRDADYYDQMVLVWLDVDTRIREASGDKRSLDDFAKAFFGVDNGSHEVKTYTFDDVVTALNQVQPADWRTFLRARLDQHDTHGLLEGLERSGWTLTYDDTPNLVQVASTRDDESNDFGSSIGLSLEKDGKVRDVRWNGPSFKAGIGAGNTVVAVNGFAYKGERVKVDLLRDAIVAAEHDGAPIEILIRDGDQFRVAKVDYHGGLRIPHLTRIPNARDYLSELYSAR